MEKSLCGILYGDNLSKNALYLASDFLKENKIEITHLKVGNYSGKEKKYLSGNVVQMFEEVGSLHEYGYIACCPSKKLDDKNAYFTMIVSSASPASVFISTRKETVAEGIFNGFFDRLYSQDGISYGYIFEMRQKDSPYLYSFGIPSGGAKVIRNEDIIRWQLSLLDDVDLSKKIRNFYTVNYFTEFHLSQILSVDSLGDWIKKRPGEIEMEKVTDGKVKLTINNKTTLGRMRALLRSSNLMA